eukprot:CAMPEP_0196765108 /NCGR_PEP_ID=MMETSP1095-20130614/7610_1 /TAXON_ID=96789 ORGANISM="Chromulina nebulosa, Strain UTEXLB2642" /NCGR_SAMPLE_ID=MMETSP1095 /ASSEMBLY_ACC=CAM_ASM_000446 /LENGTH=757 /DNA_ID=CAMNT_0042122529 /DNA_START=202 /DNA_END=2472 /DNA_ORIENTATION=+
MILFGGEHNNGEITTVFNDVFKWFIDKNEWKLIESLNTPPPRCSHQAVYYKDRIYIFGGEYATLDQFYHYKDLWYLDIKTNVWKEIRPIGDLPPARSGHRMLVWRNYIVLFGGFYEAMRDVRWFNDLYLYSFQDERWIQVPYKTYAQVPKARSGHQMALNTADDCVYVYGGFSKEKNPNQKKEGKIHDDMWMLNLKPAITTGVGRNALDVQKITWHKISKKGMYPSVRCGSTMCVYKNKAIVFGGVFDEEGPRHSLISNFYNDMYAFDMERRRWYQLGLKQAKSKDTTVKKSNNQLVDNEINSDSDGEVDAKDGIEESNERNYDDGSYFGFIDENGNVIYVDIEADTTANVDLSKNLTIQITNDTSTDQLTELTTELTTNLTNKLTTELNTDLTNELTNDITNELTNDLNNELVEEVNNLSINDATNTFNNSDSNQTNNLIVDLNNNSTDNLTNSLTSALINNLTIQSTTNLSTKSHNRKQIVKEIDNKIDSKINSEIVSYFDGRRDPCPRINSCLVIRGNTLLVYGGVMELGDVEVTLDDCWSLDLNKRDHWKQVLPGTMKSMEWKGDEIDNDTEGTQSISDDDEEDDEESGSDQSDSESDIEIDIDINNMKSESISLSKSTTNRSNTLTSSKNSTKGPVNIKQEMEILRDQLNTTVIEETPSNGETLRQFYSRTTEYWSQLVITNWQNKQSTNSIISKDDIMSEKDIKREGFKLAELRYNELLPMLSRLNELEEMQQSIEQSNDKTNQSKKNKRR